MKLSLLITFSWVFITIFSGFTSSSEANDPSNNYDIQQIVTKWEKEEANKQIVKRFYQRLLGENDLSAIDKYVDPHTYIQHNPDLADGAEALKEAMRQRVPPGSPKKRFQILKLGADDDLVYVHIRSTRNNNPASVIDIYRLAEGKLVEHWCVQEELTPELLAASKNDHPYF